ncbi:TRS33 [Candida pseudojiufengensis]|uniref:TRS33 n=1 Tax=Candida pseudojiufengensis TaxID=497109 RepID=UPI002224259D|nr:TRS33 [Candida pseudojiufengensis]KAI5960749.1 TRS33 [Candida pseudojiufengensis]
MSELDPLDQQSQINYKSLQYLLQEIVPTSIRVSQQVTNPNYSNKTKTSKPSIDSDTNTEIPINEVKDLNLEDSTQETTATSNKYQTRINQQLSQIKNDLPGTINILDTQLLYTDDVTIRIEQFGYNLGLKISEILLYKNSQSTTKIIDILDIMKFICRDVWKYIFLKQIDNLRTNHRGTFVLIDNKFKWFENFSSQQFENGLQDTILKSKIYLWFPCGLIKGILWNFGIDGNVIPEITQFPSVQFNIQTGVNN